MKMKSFTASDSIFIDTSWFKGLLDPRDDFYLQANAQLDTLQTKGYFSITTNYIIDETLTLLRQKSGLELALKFRSMLVGMRTNLKIIRITAQDEFKAWEWFPKNWSKLSFTDCTSFAVMQRLDLKDVATFDDHFSRAGFNMLS